MTDPTPEQIEAAADAMEQHYDKWSGPDEEPPTYADLAEVAIVAAAGAAPQPTTSLEDAAKRFHEAYERLAPEHGYKTREESAVPWGEVPSRNKNLMIAVCAEILPSLAAPVQVDEAKLVKMVRDTIDRRPYTDETRTAIHGLENAIGREIWRRRNEWLRGGGR